MPDDRSSQPSAPSQPLALPAPSGTSEQRWRKGAYVVWTLIGGAILLGLLGYVLGVLAVPVGIVIWTSVIVFCLRGLVNWVETRGASRMAAVVVGYLVMAAVLAGVVALISSPLFGIGDQFARLAESVPSYIQSAQDAWADFNANHPEIVQNPTVAQAIDEVGTQLVDAVNAAMSSSLSGLANVGQLVGNSAICIGFALVLAFWVLLVTPDMGREVRRLFGGRHEDDLNFFYLTFTRVVGGYIKGTIIQCALITVLCAIVFLVLQVPSAIAFAIITGVLNVIPVIGPWLGGAAAALAAVQVSPFASLLALVLTIVVQQLIYTFVSPKIMSDSVDVNPMIVILSMMIGLAVGTQMSGTIGGLTGMLLGIPAAAFIKSLFIYYFEKRTGRRIVAPDGVFFKGDPAEGDSPDPTADAAATTKLPGHASRPAVWRLK